LSDIRIFNGNFVVGPSIIYGREGSHSVGHIVGTMGEGINDSGKDLK
jgi:hypothetical protein